MRNIVYAVVVFFGVDTETLGVFGISVWEMQVENGARRTPCSVLSNAVVE